jgi:predicted PurR-regulated permease PerM
MLNNDRLLAQILLLGLLAACLWVLAPFASALFWAAVLAFASWPVMRLLTRWLHGNATLAAGLLTFSWMVLVAVPLVWLGFNIADQIREANALLHDLQVEGLPPAPTWLGELPLIGDTLVGFWDTVDEQGTALIASIRPYIGQVANWLLVRSARIGGGMLELINQSFDVMQSSLAQYKIAGYPPNVLVNIPKRACRFYEFYKAPELIALGRIVAHDALIRYEEEQ